MHVHACTCTCTHTCTCLHSVYIIHSTSSALTLSEAFVMLSRHVLTTGFTLRWHSANCPTSSLYLLIRRPFMSCSSEKRAGMSESRWFRLKALHFSSWRMYVLRHSSAVCSFCLRVIVNCVGAWVSVSECVCVKESECQECAGVCMSVS